MDNLQRIVYIAKMKYRTYAAYKLSNIHGILVNIFWMVVQMYILIAFITNGISSFSVKQAIGYVVLTEALLTITGLSGALGGIDIDELIKSGNIIFFLTNPVGFIGYLLGMEIGRISYYIVWRFLPIFLVGIVCLQWTPSISLYSGMCFLISILIGLVIANEVQFIITMLAIRNGTSIGIVDLIMAIELFFSGSLLPLSLFPQWLYKLSLALPFSAQIYLPVSIILGTEDKIGQQLIIEIAWAFILFGVSYVVYIKEREKIYVQGG